MVTAPRKAKSVSHEVSVREAVCALLPSPTISPNCTVAESADRPSQLAENGSVGMTRGWAGDGALVLAAAAGAAFRSPMSRRVTPALMALVGVPLPSTRDRHPAVSSLPA